MNLSGHCSTRATIFLICIILLVLLKAYNNTIVAFSNLPNWKRTIFVSDTLLVNKYYSDKLKRKASISLRYKTSDDTISTCPEDSIISEEAKLSANKFEEEIKQVQLKKSSSNLPFGLIVNHNDIKHALLLLAVNPRIGGIVISGRRGTGKSVLARALYELLPGKMDVIKGNKFHVDPDGKFGMDSFLYNEVKSGNRKLDEMEIESVPTPFVELPLNVMEDSLIGTVDLEKSMERGETIFSPGLLAKAHRGILYVDEMNLLEDDVANILLNVIKDGFVTVEREGISFRYPCRPLLIATFNPEEGDLREHIMDRIGLSLSMDTTELTISERAQVVSNVIGYSGGSNIKQELDEASKALAEALYEQEKLQSAILSARNNLPAVKINHDQILYLCTEASRAGCVGQRAEIFATEVAKASAALNGRLQVNADDLKNAVMLAIAPRGMFYMLADDEQSLEDSSTSSSDDRHRQRRQEPISPQDLQELQNQKEEEQPEQEEDEDESKPDNNDEEDVSEEEEEENLMPMEFMFDAEATPIDPKLIYFTKYSRKGRGGKRTKIFSLTRGRYIKPIFPKGSKQGKLAVAATLRAAAPYQKFRRQLRSLTTSTKKKKVFITKDDFRIKKMGRKAGSLIIFVVDASGSMALNRMNSAKGAAISLLSEAYKSRDKICLISLHDTASQVIVPPTKSIALTKARLESMPCGGGSPLAHGLMTAMRTGLNTVKVKKDVGRVVIILITDGRPNIPLCISEGEIFDATKMDPNSKDGFMPSRQFLKDEILAVAKTLGTLNDFHFLCIDTEDTFVATGVARDIAKAAKGNYFHIVNADSSAISSVAKSHVISG